MGLGLASFPIALAVAWIGCRQLAGIEDVELATKDAAATDAPGPIDAGGDLFAPFDAIYGCECTSCTTLASGRNAPVSLLLSGGDVYFLDYGPEDGQGALLRVSTSGTGAVETVVGKLNRPFSLAADASHFYWLGEDSTGGGIVERVPIGGGAPLTLASGLATLKNVLVASVVQVPLTSNIVLTATEVYFVGFSGGQQAGVLHVPIGGGAVSTLISQWPSEGGAGPSLSVNAIASDGTSLYGVTNGPIAGVFGVPLAGGPGRAIVSNLANPWTLALSGTDILFFDVGLNFTNGTLQKVPTSGGAPTTLLTKLASPWAMAPDPGFVYYVDANGAKGGSVDVLDLGTGMSAALAGPPLLSPVAVAVDAKSVYWVDAVCGTVMKVAR